jgi:hypothetical protein
MQTADFNHNDFSNTSEADKALMVKFFYKNVQNKMESQKQGRPIYKEKTYIEIRIAGQRDAQACRPVTFKDKQRFPAHFEAFEKRMEPPTEGTPLLEWSLVPRSQAEELAFLHIKTVEQLATVKDSNIQNFMGGYALRDKAKKWLETNDVETEDREKAELKAQIATLQEQVAAMLEEATEPTPVEFAASLNAKDVALAAAADAKQGVIEGAAVEVPKAPAARRKRPSRAKK